MEPFKALVVWPSATLTDSLVRKALSLSTPSPTILLSLPEDVLSSPGNLLQWSTYDVIDHGLTHSAPSGSRVLSSSYIIRKALIRKHYLSRCIRNYLTKHAGSSIRNAVPQTWNIELSFADELDEMWTDDLFDLGQEMEKEDPNKWWILKPGMADRGMGIRLFHTKEELTRIFEQFEDDSDEEVENDNRAAQGVDTTVATSQLRHFVIQEYLSKPLLLDPAEVRLNEPKFQLQNLRGHKFHLRVYCVASGALTVYMYTHILALFSAVPYGSPVVSTDQPSSTRINEDLAPHLTNTSLQTEHGEAGVRLFNELIGCHVLSSSNATTGQAEQRQAGSYRPSPPRAMDQVMDVDQIRAARKLQAERAAQHKILTLKDVDDIKSQIADALGETFKAALEMSVHFQPLPNAFELYGVDFLVNHAESSSSRKFQVHLLEVNSEPAIELTGPRLTWILEDLFRAVGKVCVAPFFSEVDIEEKWQVDQTRGALRKCLDVQVRGAQGW